MSQKKPREGDIRVGDVDLGNLHDLGIGNVQQSFANYQRIFRCHQAAMRGGFYIEAIATYVYICEFLLTIWLSKNPESKWSTHKIYTFGQLISLLDPLKKNPFEPSLKVRLQALNTTRNEAIHRLLRGQIEYDALRQLILRDYTLSRDLGAWVRSSLQE